MPFNGTTTYTPTSGAETAAPGQTVQSAVWNAINEDYAEALTELNSQYSSVNTNRNLLYMNGGFEVWQRGAGNSSSIAIAASTTGYTSDRWYITTGVNQASVISAQSGLSSQSNLCARIIRNAAQTGTTAYTFAYPLDTDEIVRMRGKTVYFTCLVRTGATWSATSVTAVLYLGTGSVQKRGGGFTNETQAFNIATTIAAASPATQITGASSAVVPTTTTQAELQFQWTPSGTAGATDYIEIDDVSIEVNTSSDTWTPMNYDRTPFADQLAACKRFYCKTFPYSVAPAQAGGNPGALGIAILGPNIPTIWWQFPVELRVTAAVTTYNPAGASANWQNNTLSASNAVTSDANVLSTKCALLYGTTATGTATIAQLLYIQAQADAGI